MVLRQFPLALRGVVLVQRQHLVLEENGLFVGEEASEELEVGGGEIAHADMADVQVGTEYPDEKSQFVLPPVQLAFCVGVASEPAWTDEYFSTTER